MQAMIIADPVPPHFVCFKAELLCASRYLRTSYVPIGDPQEAARVLATTGTLVSRISADLPTVEGQLTNQACIKSTCLRYYVAVLPTYREVRLVVSQDTEIGRPERNVPVNTYVLRSDKLGPRALLRNVRLNVEGVPIAVPIRLSISF